MLTILAILTIIALWPLSGRAASKPPANVDRALRNASRIYRVPYTEMVAVAWCESRFNPNAVGQGSHGLFQFLRSTWAHTPYAAKNIYSPWWNALAAAWLWRHDGGTWREWTCGRLNGLR